jgi:hypothetical protein
MTRAELHRLVDALPDSAVDPIGGLLERAVADPMIAILDAAPWDDEVPSEEEEATAAGGIASYRDGEGIALDKLLSEAKADG